MKAILAMDIDEKYIGSIGTEIQFINQKYNCKWKLKPMPQKKKEDLDIPTFSSSFERGWNACLEALEDSHNGEDSNDESNTCVEVISNEKNAV